MASWFEKKGAAARETLAGLESNELAALKETPKSEFETMLAQAKKAV